MALVRFFYLFVLILFISSCSSTRQPIVYYYYPGPGYEAAEQPAVTPQKVMPYKPSIASKGVIVLDAGHGGKDLGTVSTVIPHFEEKVANLQTTQMVSH